MARPLADGHTRHRVTTEIQWIERAVDLPDAITHPEPIGKSGVVWRSLDGLVDAVLAIALFGELGVVLTNIFVRSVMGFSLVWIDEVSQIALSILAFLGGAIAYPRGQHIAVQILHQRLSERGRLYRSSLVDWVVFVAAVTVARESYALARASWHDHTILLQLPAPVTLLPINLGFALLALYTLRLQWRRPFNVVVTSGLGTGLFVALVIATHSLWQPLVEGQVLWLVLASFAVLIFCGVPVGFVLMLGSIEYFYGANTVPLVAIAQSTQSGVGQFVLLAIPFFVLAGLLMDAGGVSRRLVNLISSLVGHFRGGLLQSVIASMYLYSGISGSKTADVAAVGSALSKSLERAGYRPGESVAVLSASAAMGETIPPSIAMIVLGSITTVSIGALFLAGLLPAALIAGCLSIAVYIRARRTGMPRAPRPPARLIMASGVRAIPALLMPVMLFGGIVLGIATPTEVSSFTVVYGVALGMFGYRELRLRDVWSITTRATTLVGMVLLIVGSANAFALAVTVEMVPQRLSSAMAHAPGGKVFFLVATLVALIVFGAVLEGLPALLLLAPILLPIAAGLGINELHYAIVLVIAMGIGAFSPPLGIGYYISCAVCQTPPEDGFRPMMTYVGVLIVGLLLVTFVPDVTLIVPRVFHVAGAG
jgi:tripartite ATP-independent transporter DctM subunit